jgi:hypothetical protein
MSYENGWVPQSGGEKSLPAQTGNYSGPRMTRSAGPRHRTTCSGIARQANGRRCRKTTLHPSGYCHVHCDPQRHHRECEPALSSGAPNHCERPSRSHKG